jgi:hypothetical protein
MIINAQGVEGNNCARLHVPSALEAIHTNIRKASSEEVWKYDRQEQVTRNTDMHFKTSTSSKPRQTGTIGPAEDILNRYVANGSGCTGLVVGEYENFSSTFLHFRDFITLSPAK